MARPRKKELKLSALDCFEIVRKELEQNPELEGFDISRAKLLVKQNKPAYVPNLDMLKKAIYRLRVFLSEKDVSKPIELSKNQLSKILHISRPTINKWIDAKIIEKEAVDLLNDEGQNIVTIPYITAQSTLKSLKLYLTENKKS